MKPSFLRAILLIAAGATAIVTIAASFLALLG